ncbi:hypothetical protein VRRI112168_20220 [Vreelandella rituensis]
MARDVFYASNTSAWVFDGSGRVKHNADLSASYNTGARYWAWKYTLTWRKSGQVSGGKRFLYTPIMLSTLWRSDEARLNAQHYSWAHSLNTFTSPSTPLWADAEDQRRFSASRSEEGV